ncbi:helix-turn-helix transcriptional regulator [Tissierella sp. MB52-C2]|uniref:helix-turn-helix transcriptional regulator n=1 Tax=Tissierella sp. MB52-C2 TaxID=3070999 RepID=UPI00280BA677|nr:helix-turn-helix transcriptional regulator [Tissierella sp. MB52-C2]WMM26703.1 helix-turn-helix transcriptional regulator [Tissierella sp. MB52-C2]
MNKRKFLIDKRKNNQWSQEYVAKKLNTTQQLISFIEQGKRNPSLIIAKGFEEIYETPMEKLFPDIFLNNNTTKRNVDNHTA